MISGGTPKAKAILWYFTDVEVRQRGDQKGLDTPVVHAVNDDLSMKSQAFKVHQVAKTDKKVFFFLFFLFLCLFGSKFHPLY